MVVYTAQKLRDRAVEFRLMAATCNDAHLRVELLLVAKEFDLEAATVNDDDDEPDVVRSVTSAG